MRRAIRLAAFTMATCLVGGLSAATAQDQNPFDPEEARQELRQERERQAEKREQELEQRAERRSEPAAPESSEERSPLEDAYKWVRQTSPAGCFNGEYVFKRGTGQQTVFVTLKPVDLPSGVDVNFLCGE